MLKINLRKAREEDLNAIHEIETFVYLVPWSYNFFRIILHMNKNMFIVATLNEKIIGYIIGEIKINRKNITKGHIMNIAVSNEYQGKGVGTILLDEIEKKFLEKKVIFLYLEVRESNKRAQKIYKNRGYNISKILKNYYGDENGFIMSKKLTR